MDDLIVYLRKFGQLTDQEVALICGKATERKLSKGQYYVDAGAVSRKIGFVIDGVFRICYYNRSGEDFTRYFVYENRFVADMDSFLHGLPALEYIEAVSNCKVLEFSKSDFLELSNQIHVWNDLFSKITLSVIQNKMKAAGNMLVQDAQSRYLHFLQHYPGLANRIPQTMLASYLGITATSLSRIRKSIR